MNTLASHSSIVRKIWGTSDMVLFIFAGAAAEFALNREVDWLFYTGKLPADPIGRLFSTVQYAQQIIFSDKEVSNYSIGSINAIHARIEASRGRQIPEAAYKDVLFMLIHYSIAACEVLERKLNEAEKDEILDVFRYVGSQMGITNLPGSFLQWKKEYWQILQTDLERSSYTDTLFRQYRKHLGPLRYYLLREVQKLLVTAPVSNLLKLGEPVAGKAFILVYKIIRKTAFNNRVILLLVPRKYKQQVKMLNGWRT
jgi:uncharacterized protein (DUF2236 family)